MSEAVTTETIIEMITAAGLDYHDFKCQAAAKNHDLDLEIAAKIPGHPANTWVSIAEMIRPNTAEATWVRAWELGGVPIPEEYVDAA